MKMLGSITLAALVLLALFTVANWSLLAAPATLDLLALSVQGPLGLILLGVTLGFVALFAVYALSLRTQALLETRQHLKALESQRALADSAEASRFTALGTRIDQEAARLGVLIESSCAQVLQRADTLDQSLKRSIDESANAIFANIGQVDDKIDRLVRPAPVSRP